MAMTYTTLVGDVTTEDSIKYWVRHSKVPSTSILSRAEAAIYAKLKVREMMARATGSIAQNATTITLPADCIFPIGLYLTRNYKGKIDLLDQDHYERITGEDEDGNLYEGTPCRATFDKTLVYLDVKADQTYYYRLWYLQKPAALSDTNTTNFLTDRYEHILEAMCKHYAWKHRGEKSEANDEYALAAAAINEANANYDNWLQAMRLEAFWSSDQ